MGRGFLHVAIAVTLVATACSDTDEGIAAETNRPTTDNESILAPEVPSTSTNTLPKASTPEADTETAIESAEPPVRNPETDTEDGEVVGPGTDPTNAEFMPTIVVLTSEEVAGVAIGTKVERAIDLLSDIFGPPSERIDNACQELLGPSSAWSIVHWGWLDVHFTGDGTDPALSGWLVLDNPPGHDLRLPYDVDLGSPGLEAARARPDGSYTTFLGDPVYEADAYRWDLADDTSGAPIAAVGYSAPVCGA